VEASALINKQSAVQGRFRGFINRLLFGLEIFAGVVTPSENTIVFAFPPCCLVSKMGAKPPFMIIHHCSTVFEILTAYANLFHFSAANQKRISIFALKNQKHRKSPC
jgi:hypothetical protein